LWPKQKTSYATIGTPIDVFFPLAITKYLNVYTNMHAYTQFLSFINFVTSKTIITCIQFSSCNHSGLVLGPGFFIQVNSGAVVYRPRHLGCEMSGFGPLSSLSSSAPPGGEFPRQRRRRGARVHGALAWSLLLCFAARIRWRQGERRDTNERISDCKAK
jgi:hypothetical protein